MTTTYEDLRQRMIDGDTKVTPTELDKARRAADYAAVQAEADEARRAREAEAQRQLDLVSLRKKAKNLIGEDIEDLRLAYSNAVAAGHHLRAALELHRADIRSLDAENIRLGAHEELPPELDVAFAMDWAIDEIRAGHRVTDHRLNTEA